MPTNDKIDFYHAFLAFFYFLSFFFSFFSSSLTGLASSSLIFLRRFMVTLAVVATLVANSKAPPAKVTLHPLHFQMPLADLFTWDYISCVILFHKLGIRTSPSVAMKISWRSFGWKNRTASRTCRWFQPSWFASPLSQNILNYLFK